MTDRPIITVGCSTTCGGVVVTGSPASFINGKAMARVGDYVDCRCKGLHRIASGDPTFIDEGSPVARHGDSVTCGAKLIGNQHLCIVVDGSGAPMQTSPAAPLLDLSEPPIEFEDFKNKDASVLIQFLDDDNHPFSFTEYSAKILSTGKVIRGVTDIKGFIEIVETTDEEDLEVHLEID